MIERMPDICANCGKTVGKDDGPLVRVRVFIGGEEVGWTLRHRWCPK